MDGVQYFNTSIRRVTKTTTHFATVLRPPSPPDEVPLIESPPGAPMLCQTPIHTGQMDGRGPRRGRKGTCPTVMREYFNEVYTAASSNVPTVRGTRCPRVSSAWKTKSEAHMNYGEDMRMYAGAPLQGRGDAIARRETERKRATREKRIVYVGRVVRNMCSVYTEGAFRSSRCAGGGLQMKKLGKAGAL